MFRIVIYFSALLLACSAETGYAQYTQPIPPAIAESDRLPETPFGDLGKETYQFNFYNVPWDFVLSRFAQKANLTLDMTDLPPGGFNYVDKREYTLAETLDIINGYLLPRGYVLLRRNQFLVVIKTDNPVLPNLIPTISTEDLDQYGDHELLRIVVPVQGFKPSEVAEQISQFLGANGKASPVDASESVLLQGFGKSLRVAVKILENTVAPAAVDELVFKAFPLRYIPAADAERQIQKLFGLGTSPFAANRARWESYRRRRDDDDKNAPPSPTPLLQSMSMNMKVSSMGRTNSVLVTATPAAVNLVEGILESIDVQQPGGDVEFLDDSTPVLRVHIVNEADEDDVAETVDAIMPGVVINEDGRQDSIHIFATPREHAEVEKLIQIIDQGGKGGGVEVISLYRSDPYMMKDLLSSLFQNEDRDDRPVITAEPRTRSLVVRATSSQMAEIKTTLAAYGETGSLRGPVAEASTRSSRFRKIMVPDGRAEWIAKTVKDMMTGDPEFGNPIRVVVPGEISEKPADESSQDGEQLKRTVAPTAKITSDLPATLFASAKTTPCENQEESDSLKRARVTIEVQNGQLFLYSNDGTALDEIEETVRELAREMPARSNWTMFYLRAANAAETAEQLGQLLQDSSDAYVSVGASSRYEPVLPYGVQAVRIIPDSRTNALFISGPASKIAEAEKFLELLDTAELPVSLRDRVPRPIPIKYADINAVATMVRELYKDYLEDPNARRQAERRDDRSNDRRSRVEVQRKGDTPQPVGIRLTLSVDEQANELIVSCNDSLYRQIKELVERRDLAAMESQPKIQIVRIPEGTTEVLVDSLNTISPKIQVTIPSFSQQPQQRSSSSSYRGYQRPTPTRYDSRSRSRR